MRIRLLGTAAGGGFPQWNCGCDNCHGYRIGFLKTAPRTQSSVAVSADGERWFLLNASPDLRQQIEAFPPLLPPDGVRRGTAVEGVLVTNADLDHTLGLFLLREGGRLAIHASPPVRRHLDEGLQLSRVLGAYARVAWHTPPESIAPLLTSDGDESGLAYSAFPVPGKPPKYLDGRASAETGDSVGYRIVDLATGGTLVYAPDVAEIDDTVLAQISDCDVLLFDGTFWSNDEMTRHGLGSATAAQMGHLPVGGPAGSLARIAPLGVPRRVFVHINNTNPMLIEGSDERAQVESQRVEIGEDGMEFTV